MKVERGTCEVVRITNAPRLDPITVFLEDYEPRRGRITIRCYDQAWTAYWGGMGEDKIAQFFCRVDAHYIAGNLAVSLDASLTDSDCIAEAARKQVIKERRSRDFSRDDARRLFDAIDYAHFGDDGFGESHLMEEIFGDEWWHRMPTKPNPKYSYLLRVISAVQDGLRQLAAEVPA